MRGDGHRCFNLPNDDKVGPFRWRVKGELDAVLVPATVACYDRKISEMTNNTDGLTFGVKCDLE